MNALMTVGEIAREIGASRPRVSYAIEKAGIREKARAGILRLYGPEQVPPIIAALGTIRPQRNAEVLTGAN